MRKKSAAPAVLIGVLAIGAGLGIGLWAWRRRPSIEDGSLDRASLPASGPDSPPAQTTPPREEPIASTPAPKTENLNPDEARDDETALARLLASEDDRRELRIVVGWITLQRATKAKRTLFGFLTRGRGYGPFYLQKKQADGTIKRVASGRHASTGEKPTTASRALARAILDGRALPSPAILSHVPGSWVERDVTLSDEQIIAKQEEYKEGIYGQIAGSKWVLFSRDTPPISVAPFEDATARLNALPKIKAITEVIS